MKAQGPVFRQVLFASVVVGKAQSIWPVAVFANEDKARAFKNTLSLLQKSGQWDEIGKADPSWLKDADGKHVTGVKWAIKAVPYSPVLDLGEDDDDAVNAS